MPLALYVQDGDPYRDEMEQCVGLIMEQLAQRGMRNHYSLAYQSRVGPVGSHAISLCLLYDLSLYVRSLFRVPAGLQTPLALSLVPAAVIPACLLTSDTM